MCDDALLELDRPVRWHGRECVLRGLDPMSVPERRAELEDVVTGERFRVRLQELCAVLGRSG